MIRTLRSLPLLAAALALAACDLAPKYTRPGAPVPPAFPTGDAYAGAPIGETPASVDWRELFTDPKLAQVIDLALANARDLRIAAANVAAARANYRVQRADLLPTINAGGDYTIRRNARSGANFAGVGGAAGGGGSSKPIETFSVDLGISAFEIDLFGRLRNLTRSALEQYLATEAGARATRLSLVAETASAWYTLAADRTLLAVSQETLRVAQASATIAQLQFQNGIASELDLQTVRTLVATTQSNIASLTTQIAQDKNALDLLVGAPVPDTLLAANLEQATLPRELPAGLASTILLRRPDVVQAERQLIAANARIGAARAAFFPRISLTSAVGLTSLGLSTLFKGDAFNWSVAPSATLPIFDFGRNRGNLAFSKAERDLYLATYEQTIQTAFREVSDALARRGTIEAQITAQQNLVTVASRSLQLADARYREGIDPYLNTLDAQRTLYSAQQTFVQTRFIQADNLVTLYRVLGGDQNF